MIAAWDQKKPAGEGHSQDSSSSMLPTLQAWTMSSTVEKSGKRECAPWPRSWSCSYSGESLLSMGALEYVLENNPEPLREFSALKDFSGENMAFLTAVGAWKKRDSGRREAYTRALGIYTDFISVRDADLAINISSQETAKLEGVFEKAARVLLGRQGLADKVAPFECGPGQLGVSELRSMAKRISYWGSIPGEFDTDIFDQAEADVKYLVLTNTWPRFVQECKAAAFLAN